MQNLKKIYHQEVTQKLIARFETDRETNRQTEKQTDRQRNKQRRRVNKSIGKKKSFDTTDSVGYIGATLRAPAIESKVA